MANPNLLQATSCKANWTNWNVGTTMSNVMQNPLNSNKILKIVSIYACNQTSSSITLQMQIGNPGGTTKIVNDVTIPANATLVIATKETPIYLEEYHTLQAAASASGIHVSVSYEDYS